MSTHDDPPRRQGATTNGGIGPTPLASLGHAAWILRHFGYKAVFIWGLFLYGEWQKAGIAQRA